MRTQFSMELEQFFLDLPFRLTIGDTVDMRLILLHHDIPELPEEFKEDLLRDISYYYVWGVDLEVDEDGFYLNCHIREGHHPMF